MVRGGSLRRVVGVSVVVLLAALLLTVHVAGRARAGPEICRQHRTDARERAAAVTGEGRRVVVVGDSWSVGLGLPRPEDAWTSRLPGEVHVAGFSGSGFSATASPCRRVSFADRAGLALRGGAGLVVVEGGLNDYDQGAPAIEQGFRRLMRTVSEHRVVVIGPASAPARESAVPRVDTLLRSLSQEYAVPYIATSDLVLPYLADGLHLTAQGHAELGSAVATRLTVTVPRRPHPLG